ncbi:hypothetical protein D3C86_1526740 [compost metagenome]
MKCSATRPEATESMSLFCSSHRLAISEDDSTRQGRGLRPALASAVSRRERIGVPSGQISQSWAYRSSQSSSRRPLSGWPGRATTRIGSLCSRSLHRLARGW